MNKTRLINELKKELPYSLDQCTTINTILEDHFFINSKNEDKVIEEISRELNISKEEATQTYHTAIKIIKNEIKYKLKHPFKSQDEN